MYGTHVSRRHIIFIKGNHKFAVFIEVITFIAGQSLEILIRHIGLVEVHREILAMVNTLTN